MNDSPNTRLTKNAIFMFVRMLIVMGITLFTTRLVLRTLGVEDYGIYNVVAGFVSLFTIIGNSLTTGTNRFYNIAIGQRDDSQIKSVYNSSVRIQVFLLIILLVFVEIVGIWYINNKLVVPLERLDVARALFQCSVISLSFVVLSIPYSAAILAYEKLDFFALVSIFDAVSKLIVIMIVNHLSYDKLYTYGVLMVAITIGDFLFYSLYCYIKFPLLRITKSTDWKLTKSLLSFSALSIIDPFSYMVKDQGSNLLLNSFFGPVLNAAYGIGAQVSGAVSSFASNLSIAFRPQIMQSYSAGNGFRAKKLIKTMSKAIFILQAFVAIPLICEMEYVLTLWLGSYPKYTPVIARLVIIISWFNSLNEPISIIMLAIGKIKKIKITSMFIICSVIPVGYFLFCLGLPPYSIYVAMALITIINQIVCISIMSRSFLLLSQKEYHTEVFLPLIIETIVAFLPPIVIHTLLSTGITRLLFLSSISIMVTAISSYCIVLNRVEKEALKKLMISFYNKIIKA